MQVLGILVPQEFINTLQSNSQKILSLSLNFTVSQHSSTPDKKEVE